MTTGIPEDRRYMSQRTIHDPRYFQHIEPNGISWAVSTTPGAIAIAAAQSFAGWFALYVSIQSLAGPDVCCRLTGSCPLNIMSLPSHWIRMGSAQIELSNRPRGGNGRAVGDPVLAFRACAVKVM